MKLDFLIAGSCTPAFLSQIAIFQLCLKALGGSYANARLVAVLGDQEINQLPACWRMHFDGIEVEWAHAPGEINSQHALQHYRRFETMRPDADCVFICDADVAVVRPFDDLLRSLSVRPALAGVIAHYHFTWPDHPQLPTDERRPEEDWLQLSTSILGKPIDTPYRYTLLGEHSLQRAPFYINYGVLAGPPDLFRASYLREQKIGDKVTEVMGHWWGPQISLALAVADLGLPTQALPMRYNFPNDPTADTMFPDELENIVFMHYLREHDFDRHAIFATEKCFDQFINMELKGSSKIFQDLVMRITGSVYPFGTSPH